MNLVRNALFVGIVALLFQCALVATRPTAGVNEQALLVNLAPALEASSSLR